MKKAYVTLSYGQMHYRYGGKGAPVLFLHMSGSSSDEYNDVGKLLAENFRIYSPDFYGFGSSDDPSADPERYLSMSEHMETIKEFCDALGLHSIFIVGNLVGANIACRLAAAYPELVKRLVLFQVCYHPDPNYYKNLRYGPGFAPIPLSGDGSHLMTMWARSAKYGEAPSVTDARVACLHRAGHLGEALHWALCDDVLFSRCLPQISAPAKIYGYDFMNAHTAALAAELIPNGRYEEIKQATPLFPRADPQLCREKIMEFLL